jgi:nicotinate-nucleotide adenylyltransferase
MSNAAPVGLMGGTFDPVHYGHLRLAEEAAEHLALEGVRWIPSGSPGHRATPRTAAHHRLEMVRLAIQSNVRFTLDASEAHATTPQFTIDTLRRMRGELGDALPLMLIIGADQLYKLDTWRAWRDLFAFAHCAVGERPGYPLTRERLPSTVAAELAHREAPRAAIAAESAGRIVLFPMTALAISASDLRQRFAGGASVRYLLPPEVLAYIESHGLYREGPKPA